MTVDFDRRRVDFDCHAGVFSAPTLSNARSFTELEPRTLKLHLKRVADALGDSGYRDILNAIPEHPDDVLFEVTQQLAGGMQRELPPQRRVSEPDAPLTAALQVGYAGLGLRWVKGFDVCVCV